MDGETEMDREVVIAETRDVGRSPEIAALIVRAFDAYRGRLDPEPSAVGETGASIAARFADHRVIVAEQAGRLVGCVFLKPGEGGIYLGRLAVAAERRRSGLASRLVAAAEQVARATGARRITLGVRIGLAGNQALFARAGFVEIARRSHPGYAEPTFIEMAKDLG